MSEWKPRLTFNRGLALVGFRTTQPRFLPREQMYLCRHMDTGLPPHVYRFTS